MKTKKIKVISSIKKSTTPVFTIFYTRKSTSRFDTPSTRLECEVHKFQTSAKTQDSAIKKLNENYKSTTLCGSAPSIVRVYKNNLPV